MFDEQRLEEALFGDKHFQEADPQYKALLCLARTYSLTLNFIQYPSPEKAEMVVYAQKRLQEFTHDFIKAYQKDIEGQEAFNNIPRSIYFLHSQKP